jgi:hypothetical protein
VAETEKIIKNYKQAQKANKALMKYERFATFETVSADRVIAENSAISLVCSRRRLACRLS